MTLTLKSPWTGVGLALAVAVPLGLWAGDGLSGDPASDGAETDAATPPAVAGEGMPTAWDLARKDGDDAWYSAVVGSGNGVRWPEDEAPDVWEAVAAAGADAWDATAEAGASAWDWTADNSAAAWDWTAQSSAVAWNATVDAGATAWDWSADAASDAADWTAGAAAAGWDATLDALDATGEAIGELLE